MSTIFEEKQKDGLLNLCTTKSSTELTMAAKKRKLATTMNDEINPSTISSSQKIFNKHSHNSSNDSKGKVFFPSKQKDYNYLIRFDFKILN